MTVYVGIKCDYKNVIGHGISEDYIILFGKFTQKTDFNHIFKKLFNDSYIKMVDLGDAFAVFNVSTEFYDRYNILMKDKHIEYFSNNPSAIKITQNIFKMKIHEIFISNVKPIAYYTDNFNMIDKPSFSMILYIVFKDINEIKFKNYKNTNFLSKLYT